MKNKLFNIIVFAFLLNSINIFSSNDTIKEVEPIESIHSDENSSVFVNDNSKSVSESSFEENYKRCFGIVGSGNRNFNNQYCLTAKQYSQRFGFPVLDTFELRGLNEDIKRIGLKIEELYGL